MNKRKWLVLAGAIAALCVLAWLLAGWNQAVSDDDDPIILQTAHSTFSKKEVIAMIDLNCRKYGLTLEDLHSDPGFWNQMVHDIVFEYAGAEIARELAPEYGLDQLSSEQKAAGAAYAESLLSDIEAIGEEPGEYLTVLGFTKESLIVYGENRVYETFLQERWAEKIELSADAETARYQKIINYTNNMQDEIEQRTKSGVIQVDMSPLLQEMDKS